MLQTLITRLITLTRRIQNWNNSEYVTIAVSPLPLCQGATKRGEPPADARGAARLPFIGSTMHTVSHFSAKSNPISQIEVGFDKFCGLRYNGFARIGLERFYDIR